MLPPVSTLSEFKRMVSRVSTVLLLAGLVNLAVAPLFDDWILRSILCPITVAMSLTVKKALASYDANPARSLSIIEANFYGLCALVLLGSIYSFCADPDFRSVSGVALVGFGLAISFVAFLRGRENLQFARSLLSDGQI